MQPVSQLLLRNAERFQCGNGRLWLNPPIDLPARQVGINGRSDLVFCQDFPSFSSLRRSGLDAHFGDLPAIEADNKSTIVLRLPKEKARLRMLAHWAAWILAPGGTLWVAGENRAGAKSSPRQLADRFRDVGKCDSARHCTLVRARQLAPGRPFTLDDYREEFTVSLRRRKLTVCSWPGVFSHGALDEGTRLLLSRMPNTDGIRSVLDFACGAGVLGAALLAENRQLEVTFVDGDALACRATRATLAANSLEGTVHASDGLKQVQGRFDLVVSNPPFHVGPKTKSGLGVELLDDVRNYLRPGGQLLLVGNSHLPYRRWLDECFGQHRLLISNGRYNVLQAHMA